MRREGRVEARARATRASNLTNPLLLYRRCKQYDHLGFIGLLLGVVWLHAPFLLRTQRDARPEPRFAFRLLLLASFQHFLRNHSRPGSGWLGRDWTQSREFRAVKGYEGERVVPRMDFVVPSLAGVAELYEDDLRTRLLGGSIVGWQKQHRAHYMRKM